MKEKTKRSSIIHNHIYIRGANDDSTSTLRRTLPCPPSDLIITIPYHPSFVTAVRRRSASSRCRRRAREKWWRMKGKKMDVLKEKKKKIRETFRKRDAYSFVSSPAPASARPPFRLMGVRSPRRPRVHPGGEKGEGKALQVAVSLVRGDDTLIIPENSNVVAGGSMDHASLRLSVNVQTVHPIDPSRRHASRVRFPHDVPQRDAGQRRIDRGSTSSISSIPSLSSESPNERLR